MKRKDQMLIILELLEEIDTIKVHNYQDAIPMLTTLQSRIFTLQSVIPNDSTFNKILDHFANDIQSMQDELYKNLEWDGVRL